MPEQKSETPQADEKKPRHLLKWYCAILIILFIAMFAVFGYAYFQLSRVNLSLAQTVSALENQMTTYTTDFSALQKSVNTLQTSEQKSQELSAKQEQIIADWQAAQQGNLNKWYAAEAQYLVRLANDHVQYTHDFSLAAALLDRADAVLQNMQEASVAEIRKSLAADINQLQTISTVNITQTYSQLTAINNQVDQLPLPVSPLKTNANTPLPNSQSADLPWWKKGLNNTWHALRQLVVVRYNGSNALPLVLPEEKNFLYQNLHAQIENVMWGLLYHNNEVYQASLTRAISWIQQYFVQDVQETQTILQDLRNLQAINVQPPAIDFTATLQLFTNYLGQQSNINAGDKT